MPGSEKNLIDPRSLCTTDKKSMGKEHLAVRVSKLKRGCRTAWIIFAGEIQNTIAMKFDDLKKLVKTTSVKITSEMRYSELHALAETAGLHENTLTIVIKSGTLSDSELLGLANVGKGFVNIDLSED